MALGRVARQAAGIRRRRSPTGRGTRSRTTTTAKDVDRVPELPAVPRVGLVPEEPEFRRLGRLRRPGQPARGRPCSGRTSTPRPRPSRTATRSTTRRSRSWRSTTTSARGGSARSGTSTSPTTTRASRCSVPGTAASIATRRRAARAIVRSRLPIDGYFVQAAYLLTGETINERTVVDPIRRFDLRPGRFGLGAFEPHRAIQRH